MSLDMKAIMDPFKHGPVRELPGVLGAFDMPGFTAFPYASPRHVLPKRVTSMSGSKILTDGVDYLFGRLRLNYAEATASIKADFGLLAALIIARSAPVTTSDIYGMEITGDEQLTWRFTTTRWNLRSGTVIVFEDEYKSAPHVLSITHHVGNEEELDIPKLNL